jgi:hypothetical protein
MPSAGFEPAVLGVQRLQTDALERTAIGIGTLSLYNHENPTLISGIFAKGNNGRFYAENTQNQNSIL